MRVWRTILVVSYFGAFAGGDGAPMVEKDNVQIIHPWAEPTEGAKARVFPTISNEGDSEIVLVGAASPVADVVEMIVAGRRVDRVSVAGGDVIAFTEPNTHFRPLGLSEPLEEGDHFPMLLRLGDGNLIEFHGVIGENTAAPDLVPQGRAKANLTHRPIPALGWPTMTMDLALLDGASTDGLAVGDTADFELSRGPDGMYALLAIWPAGSAPRDGRRHRSGTRHDQCDYS